MATPQTIHGQRVGAGFQDGVFSAGIAHFREHSLQVDRFRRGVGRGISSGGVPYAIVPKRPVLDLEALMMASTSEVVVVFPLVPVSRPLQSVGGVIVEICGGDGQSFARVADLNGGDLEFECCDQGFFGGDSHCAAADGVLDKSFPIFFCAAQREEKCTGLYFA